MSRSLGVGITADIAAATGERCQLIQFDFANLSNVLTPIYLTTAAQNILWNGFTFLGTGHTLDIDAMGESADEPGNGLRVKLSGVEQSIMSAILTSRWRGRLCTIWYAALDQSTGAIKADPVLMFQGPMNGGFEIGESRGDFGGGTVDITARLTTRLDELIKVRGVKCNVASHQASGITGAETSTLMQNVDNIMMRRVFWGMKEPKLSPNVPHGPGTPTEARPNPPAGTGTTSNPGGGNGPTTNPGSLPTGTNPAGPGWGGHQPGQTGH